MALKTYVLLEHTAPTVPIFVHPTPSQRVKIDKRKNDSPFLQQTYQDKKGEQKTIRLKKGCNTIFQDEQIKLNVPANAPFTQQERDAVRFVWGVCQTSDAIVQKFFDETPQNEKFWIKDPKSGGYILPSLTGNEKDLRYTDQINRPLFKEYDPTIEIKSENAAFKKRLEAANAIMQTDLAGAQKILTRINGAHFDVPDNLEEAQNLLVTFLDETDEAGMALITQKELTKQDKMLETVGEAVRAGVLNFDKDPEIIFFVKSGKSIEITRISAEYDANARVDALVDYLVGDGELVAADIQRELASKKKASK